MGKGRKRNLKLKHGKESEDSDLTTYNQNIKTADSSESNISSTSKPVKAIRAETKPVKALRAGTKPANTIREETKPVHAITSWFKSLHVRRARPHTETCIRLCAYFISIVTVILLVYLINLSLTWIQLRTKALEQKESETCVSCRNLRSTDTLDVVPQGAEEYLCCGSASKVITEMVAKFTEKKFVEETQNRLYPFSFPGCNENLPLRPAARVSGISQISKQDVGEHRRIFWNTTSFQADGLTYVDGSFEIAETAIYYVSFQVTYDVTSENSNSKTVFRAQVKKMARDSSDTTILVESSKSPCKEEAGRHVTSATGAIFQLDRDDRVFVTTSHPDNLHSSEELNFFTIHKL